MSIISTIRHWLEPKPKVFPQNSSWMIGQNGDINWENVKHCQEFIDLSKVGHSHRFHTEGNAWKHTQLVVQELKELIKRHGWYFSPEEKKILLLAALCHDLGKATTTYYDEKEHDYCCKSHGAAGEKITRKLLYDEPILIREEICWLVRWHMNFHQILNKPRHKAIEMVRKLSKGGSTIEKLAFLNLADSRASHSINGTDESMDKFNTVLNIAMEQDCLRKPCKEKKVLDKFTMYVMIGLPGSGKDTYISKFLKNLPVICRDDIREELKDGQIKGRKLSLSPKDEKAVTNIVNDRIKNCCLNKVSFIINQTSLKKKYREEFNKLAYQYATPKIVYVYIEAPSIQTCIDRRGGGKWEEIINRMNDNFEFPDKSECDDLIIIKQEP